MDIETINKINLKNPNKGLGEIEKAMINALGIERNKIDLTSDDQVISAKSRAYHELLGMADRHTLSPKFDTVMASKSAMLLASVVYAFEKNNVSNTNSASISFTASVITQDKKAVDFVQDYFRKKEFPTIDANFKNGTVSSDIIMQDIKTFFKDQFGMEFEKAMAVRKIDDLQKKLG